MTKIKKLTRAPNLIQQLQNTDLLDESERDFWLESLAKLPPSEQAQLGQQLGRAAAESDAEQDRHQAALAEIAANLERGLAELAKKNRLEETKKPAAKSFADEILDSDFLAELRKYES